VKKIFNTLKMKNFVILIFAFLLAKTSFSQSSAFYNLRSDTIDVLHYEVNLNITDFTTKIVFGDTKVTFSPKMTSVNSLSLDLLGFTVDSVIYNGLPIAFDYNDTLLVCYFASAILDADTEMVDVFYKGVPEVDPTWGGFYFQSGYAYNLGVGFTSVPHNYGRVFHPCFDNFVERATYEFNITTNGGKVSYCNGFMASETVVGPDLIRKWILTDPIPSYLACLAVNSYTHVNQQYVSAVTTDTTPTMLISLPVDTTNFKNSFVNLFNAMDSYETNYGPYEWDKIGFVVVPFSGGAMEHATCIAYPKFAITGSTTYQSLMAHELSHHWWGDLVTCETAEEMWINEGMASWSEALFFEKIGGYTAYLNDIRPNHKNVVWQAHINDGGAYAIANVPSNVTYGTTTYNKGKDMVHCLRGYLGDTLFFNGLKSVIANYKFKSISSLQFRDHLNTLPGINVTNFFDDWVLQPGFLEFAVDSFSVVPSGPNFDVTVYSKQKIRLATHLGTGVPMEVSFKDNNFNSYVAKATLSGSNQVFTITNVPFNPSIVFFNEGEKISEAVTAHQQNITTTGTKLFANANFTFNVSSISDTVWARVEQHWVEADAFAPANFLYSISPDRFWRVHMAGDVAGLYSKATIAYNGAASNLDNALMALLPGATFNEDSLRLFYRKDATENWQVFNSCTFNMGSLTDKVGSVTIDSLKAGDYAYGIRTGVVSVSEKKRNQKFAIYPNPASSQVTIQLKTNLTGKESLLLMDVNGSKLRTINIVNEITSIDANGLSRGSYLVSLVVDGRIIETRKLILK
jgi:aminopeptidase N